MSPKKPVSATPPKANHAPVLSAASAASAAMNIISQGYDASCSAEPCLMGRARGPVKRAQRGKTGRQRRMNPRASSRSLFSTSMFQHDAGVVGMGDLQPQHPIEHLLVGQLAQPCGDLLVGRRAVDLADQI